MSHVLFISHARGLHGAEAVMLQAAKACTAYGARVTVAVPSVVPDAGLDDALRTVQGVQVTALPYRAAGGGIWRTRLVRLYNLFALWRLCRLVKRERVSTIYSNTTITILGAELARRTGVRHVWHWHEPVDSRYGWHESMREYYRRLAQETDHIVCISRQQKAEWQNALGLPLENAGIIYNPIKPIAVPDLKEGHQGVCIGFIGHFEERKNLPLLLRAFETLHRQVSTTTLTLCGAIDEQDRLYVESLTVLREPSLRILPQTEDVASFYNRTDILVLPSWRETMPLVVLEAMQAGVCVLQTEQSGMNELLEDGKETLFFPPDQPQVLTQLLLRCMDESYRLPIAQAGQKRALQIIKNQTFDTQTASLLCE